MLIVRPGFHERRVDRKRPGQRKRVTGLLEQHHTVAHDVDEEVVSARELVSDVGEAMHDELNGRAQPATLDQRGFQLALGTPP